MAEVDRLQLLVVRHASLDDLPGVGVRRHALREAEVGDSVGARGYEGVAAPASRPRDERQGGRRGTHLQGLRRVLTQLVQLPPAHIARSVSTRGLPRHEPHGTGGRRERGRAHVALRLYASTRPAVPPKLCTSSIASSCFKIPASAEATCSVGQRAAVTAH